MLGRKDLGKDKVLLWAIVGQSPICPPSTEGGGYGKGWGGWREKEDINRGVESGKLTCLTLPPNHTA